tara:strand:+ start:327 stop:515 length:189 start_codon:yes stop_codon:yes gene_type:complete
MFNNIDKRIKYAVGIVFIMGSLFGGLVGYDLKSVGQKYNHIWALSILALYAGVEWISRAMKD